MDARKQLLEQAEQAYTELETALAGLNETDMRQVWLGHWSVRDIVAHITGWHTEMIPALERLQRGEPPYPDGAYDDVDGWNARFVAARRDHTTLALVQAMDDFAPRTPGRGRPAARGVPGRGSACRGAGRRCRGRALPRARGTDPSVAGRVGFALTARERGVTMITELRGASIWSEDVNNLLPFYRDVLGLAVTTATPGFVVLGGLWLGTHSEVHGRNADPARHMIGLTSNDLTADWTRLKAAGVEFVEDPTDYGTVRIATLKDPEGNLVQLLQSSRP